MSVAIPASVKLGEQLAELFLIHDIPKLLVPVTPSRHVVVAMVELHAHAENYCGSLNETRKTTAERMVASLEAPHPNWARYFVLRNNLITLLSEERLKLLPKVKRTPDEISVYKTDRIAPIVEFDWSVSGSFIWLWRKLVGLVKRN